MNLEGFGMPETDPLRKRQPLQHAVAGQNQDHYNAAAKALRATPTPMVWRRS
jgi:hypothetical protein